MTDEKIESGSGGTVDKITTVVKYATPLVFAFHAALVGVRYCQVRKMEQDLEETKRNIQRGLETAERIRKWGRDRGLG